MKKVKKMAWLVLLVMLVFSIVSGCQTSEFKEPTDVDATEDEPGEISSGDVEKDGKKSEPVKVKVYCMFTNLLPEENNVLHQYILEKFNIDFEYDVTSIDQQTNKINMWLASGDAPGDVVRVATDINLVWQLGRAGYIIPTDDLLDQYPITKAAWDNDIYEILWKDPETGKMFFFPACGFQSDRMVVHDLGLIIREDLLKQSGEQAPTNLDELYTVLKAFKETIGTFNGQDIIPLGQSPHAGWVLPLHFGYETDFETKTLFNVNKQAYGEYWLYMNKLYREGLMDQEWFTIKSDQINQKLSSGAVGFSVGYWYDMDAINNSLRTIDPNAKFIGNQWLTGVNGFKATRQDSRDGWHHHQVLITSDFAKDTEAVDRFVEFLAWTYDDEGSFITKYGPPDKYFVEGEGGMYTRTPECEELQALPGNAWQTRSGIWFYDIANMHEMDFKVLQFSNDTADMCYNYWWENFNWERKNMVKWVLAQKKYQIDNGLKPSDHPDRAPHLYNTDVGEQYNKYTANAIMAKSEEECRKLIDEYDNYVAESGVLEEIAKYFEIYEEFMQSRN